MTAENLRGQPLVDHLLAVLDLERIEDDIFRGQSPEETHGRVFGGQVAGQALVAAGRTVPTDRQVHSLHAYFVRGGDPAIPVIYEVDHTRDGRSFSTRRVVALQHGETIFALAASFQVSEPGLEHQDPMPPVPEPEALPAGERHGRGGHPGGSGPGNRPIELRYLSKPSCATRLPGEETRNQVWMRAKGSLPDEALLHVCVLTYASDLTLLETVLAPHGVSWGTPRVLGARLDHALWFHRPFRADEWMLYDCVSPTASGSRGMATGRFFTRDGDLIATVMQEGVVLPPR
jgi:acyl-CoA thioesterase-2